MRPLAKRNQLHAETAVDLTVESLENRLMLAGNIRVTTNAAGDVSIRGDGKSNHVEITQNIDGDILIRGLQDTNGQSTGIKDGRQIVSEVVIDASSGVLSGNLTVSLGGGHDFLILRDVTVDGDFTYKSGGGSDSLGVFQSMILGSSDLRTGGGNDYHNFVDASFYGSLQAKTGGGVDFFGMSNVSVQSGKTLHFNTGGGGDIIYIEDSTVAGNLSATMGGLIDTIYVAAGTTLNGNVDVDMGGLFDLLVLENNVNVDNASLNINGGKGGFGYENLLFLYDDSPYLNSPPSGLVGFETDFYTISGNSTTGYDMSTTLSKWVMDLYYSFQPSVDIDVIDAVIAANLARGFDFADLPRSSTISEPDPSYIADQMNILLNDSAFYLYQKIFVKAAFRTELSTFDWDNYSSP